jgi:4-hydroxysphinganine ceramide fatty acyl 2-hydroxylase
MVSTFTVEEVAKHNTTKSLCVIFNDRIYDLKEFAQDHPGGDDILLEYAGKDITEVMTDKDFHEHSEVSFEMMDEYLLGDLEGRLDKSIRRLEGQRASLHRRRINLLQKEVEYKAYTKEDFTPLMTDTQVDVKTYNFWILTSPWCLKC